MTYIISTSSNKKVSLDHIQERNIFGMKESRGENYLGDLSRGLSILYFMFYY